MKALITGVPGFAGSHLAENLLAHGYKVYGTHLPGESLRNLSECCKRIELFPMDFHKPEKIPSLLKNVKPDYIFHLAALPSVGGSFLDPQETYLVNFMGTFHLLQAALELKKLPRFIMVSSSDIYGVVKKNELPIKIDHPLKPVSPYAVSKAACDMMGYQYFKNYGLPVVRVRSFSHSGPRQARGFVIPDLSFQIAQLEKSRKRKKVIKVGNLKARRDISDVRDIVDGYRLAAEKGRPGEIYQLCSGKAHAISTLLNKLIKLSNDEIKTEIDPGLSRPTDLPVLKGDVSKAENKLGYKRKYSINDTLKDCLDYYRSLQGGKSGGSS
jgi:GDP-4-dehydro-6-deoxy-D-mannose reductase